MKNAEKARLTELVQLAVVNLTVAHPQIRNRIQKCAEKYSPTNLDRFRDLAEIAWWLIAVDAQSDAIQILDALCEVNDEYYWMFQALASAFATRSWLHTRAGESVQRIADAERAFDWFNREPNAKQVTKKEIQQNLKRFDDWMDRAINEKGVIHATQVLSHALRVLVIYQQFARCDFEPARSIEPHEYGDRIATALTMLRERLDGWGDTK